MADGGRQDRALPAEVNTGSALETRQNKSMESSLFL